MHIRQYKILGIKSSEIELRDLLKAWFAISLAFAIALHGFSVTFKFFYVILIAALTVGIGFLFHEMGHKLIAQKYGCWAEFRSFDGMLIIAILISFTGFILAAPGAVMISGHIDTKRNGRISTAGPLTNFITATLFLLLAVLATIPVLKTIGAFGAIINSWLGLFNMLPFGNFDGTKILRWSKKVYGLLIVYGILLMAIVYNKIVPLAAIS